MPDLIARLSESRPDNCEPLIDGAFNSDIVTVTSLHRNIGDPAGSVRPWLHFPQNHSCRGGGQVLVGDCQGQKLADEILSFTKAHVETAVAVTKREQDGDLIKTCEMFLAFFSNVNTYEPIELAAQCIKTLKKHGYSKSKLDDAAIAILRGAARFYT